MLKKFQNRPLVLQSAYFLSPPRVRFDFVLYRRFYESGVTSLKNQTIIIFCIFRLLRWTKPKSLGISHSKKGDKFSARQYQVDKFLHINLTELRGIRSQIHEGS